MTDLELAEKHTNAILGLMSYVANRCPRQFDHDMEERFLAIARPPSSDQTNPSLDRSIDASIAYQFTDDAAGRNYTIAQASALLAFANAVAVLVERHNIELLREPQERLWQRLASTYSDFFEYRPRNPA